MSSAARKIRTGMVALASLVLPCELALAQAAAPSPQALSAALKAFGSGDVAAADIQNIRCEKASQDPAELDCRWEQRRSGEWRLHTTWLATNGTEWTVLDAPLMVPDRDRGRLKPLPANEAP